jgi:hypothetical protein
MGGTRPRRFDGTNFKPHKTLENAPTPTSGVHALLGVFCCARLDRQKRNIAHLERFYSFLETQIANSVDFLTMKKIGRYNREFSPWL